MSRSDVLVDADWVEAHLDDPKVVLVEVDEDTSAYDKNHIRNAVRIDWKDDLQDQVRRDFVSKAQFEALLSRKGIANDDTVVLYGGNNNWFAAYAYWYFKLYGHEDVKLLDGGRKKWELDSRELVADVADRPATTYTAKEQDTSIRAFRDDVARRRSAPRASSTCAARRVRRQACSPRRTCRRSSRSAAATSPRPRTSRGPRPRTTTAPSSPTRTSRLYTEAKGVDLQPGHHRVLPHRRALGAHLVRPARDPRHPERAQLRRVLDRVRLAAWACPSSWATSRARPRVGRPDVRRHRRRPVASRGST